MEKNKQQNKRPHLWQSLQNKVVANWVVFLF